MKLLLFKKKFQFKRICKISENFQKFQLSTKVDKKLDQRWNFDCLKHSLIAMHFLNFFFWPIWNPGKLFFRFQKFGPSFFFFSKFLFRNLFAQHTLHFRLGDPKSYFVPQPATNGTASLKKCKKLFEYQHLLLLRDIRWSKLHSIFKCCSFFQHRC